MSGRRPLDPSRPARGWLVMAHSGKWPGSNPGNSQLAPTRTRKLVFGQKTVRAGEMSGINRDYTEKISPDYYTNCPSHNQIFAKKAFCLKVWGLMILRTFCQSWNRIWSRQSLLTLLSVSDDLKEIWGGHASFWWEFIYHYFGHNLNIFLQSLITYYLVIQITGMVSTLHLVLFLWLKYSQIVRDLNAAVTGVWLRIWDLSPPGSKVSQVISRSASAPALSTLPGPGRASQARWILSRALARVSPSWLTWAGWALSSEPIRGQEAAVGGKRANHRQRSWSGKHTY